MSIRRHLFVRCDGMSCKNSAGPFDMRAFDAQQIRLRLKAAGWQQKGRFDFCPLHHPLKGGK